MSPDAAKPKLSAAAKAQKEQDAASGRGKWASRDEAKRKAEEEHEKLTAEEAQAEAAAAAAAKAAQQRKHQAMTRRMSQSHADSAEMRRAAKESLKAQEAALRRIAVWQRMSRRLREKEAQRLKTEKVLRGRRKRLSEGKSPVRATAQEKAEQRKRAQAATARKERK
eukprot:COSAG04_NODE_10131_length_801_cov_5.890000_2_plen_166_part_01